MTQINRTILLPTIDSFHSSIPLTSTPKPSRKSSYSPPLSSTLSTSSSQKMDLSISAITLVVPSARKQRQRRRRPLPRHSSKRIQLKHLLYATRAMKERLMKPSCHDLKIYLI